MMYNKELDLQINLYKSIRETHIYENITVASLFERIKNGGSNLSQIELARRLKTECADKSSYSQIKEQLECVTYSFLFNQYRRTNNIVNRTNLLAIDIDNSMDLPEDDRIFASYCSLSNQGRLILLIVDDLTPPLLKYNYKLIADELGVPADMNAAKATQPFVIPYDSKIYVNKNSRRIKAKSIEKKTHFINIKKEKKVIETEVGPSDIRFSNINDFVNAVDFNGEVLYDYITKFGVANVYIPQNGISKGKRNTVLSGAGFQFRALNKQITYSDLYRFLLHINEKHSLPPLPTKEVERIVNSIMNIDKKELIPTPNKLRRFVFNPDYELTGREKQSIIMTYLNREKSSKTKKKIEEKISSWDFKANGKITQKKLACETGKNIKTIKRYYSLFKDKIKFLNDEFRKNPP